MDIFGASMSSVALVEMSTFMWTFWGGLAGLSGLNRNVHIFVDNLGGLSGLGSLSGNVHICMDILGSLSGLSSLS